MHVRRSLTWAVSVVAVVVTLAAVLSTAASRADSTVGPVDATPSADPSSAPTEATPTATPSASPTTASSPTSRPTDSSSLCHRQSGFDQGAHVDRVMAGWLTIGPFAPVRIGTSGDVDWAKDPYGHPSWQDRFRRMRWVDPLLDRYHRTGDERYRTRARAIMRDWVEDNPAGASNPLPFTWTDVSNVGDRGDTLVCALQDFPGETWLTDALDDHAQFLVDHWTGAWNHGLMESLSLMRFGCALHDRTWTDLARHRMLASFAPNPLGPAIDRAGAHNEQAPGYASLNHRLWSRAQAALATCGYAVPRIITARTAKLTGFIAHATRPNGKVVQIGDSYAEPPASVEGTVAEYAATRGRAGRRPRDRVAVYAAGYVFGRSGWGTARPFGAESFYSLRFGPSRQVHGHRDHLSLTYFARGQDLLVDSGHTGYERSPYRNWLRSAQAHNVLDLPSSPFDGDADTTLRRRRIGANAQFFELANRAQNVSRTRSVLVAQKPDLVIVFDRTGTGPSQRFEQLWHLDPSLSARVVTPSSAVARSRTRDTAVWLQRVALPGQTVPDGSTTVVRGQRSPYQGWVSRRMLDRTRAPVVSMTHTGTSARMLTVITPTRRGTAVRTSIRSLPGGPYLLTVKIGRTSHRFTVTRGGTISRGA